MDNLQRDVQAIINPISGVGSKRKIPRMIEEVYSAKQLSFQISFTEYPGHAGQLARQAIERGAKYILAVGGDGTVNEVAGAMVHSDAVLGIIPKGSGNGLARDLNIPLDSNRAMEVIAAGKATAIDACKANDRIFFTTCGVGFDAAVSRRFADGKHRGSLTYARKATEELLSYKPEVYELSIGGNQSLKEKAFLVACANASQYGNNAYIAPRANICDGQMDVTILAPFLPLDIPSLAFQLFTKQIDKSSKIKIIRTDRLTITRQKPGIMHLDGEPVMTDEQIVLSVLPKALKVLVPEAAPVTPRIKNIFDQVTAFFNRELPYVFK
ncbi:MAG: diacylglycerol kinase family lipid kinase [Bacteroidales bacterium]